MKNKLFILIFLLTSFSGCAITVKESGVRDLQFFHDTNRGDVKFVCWRQPEVVGWQCQRTDLSFPTNNWKNTKKVLKVK